MGQKSKMGCSFAKSRWLETSLRYFEIRRLGSMIDLGCPSWWRVDFLFVLRLPVDLYVRLVQLLAEQIESRDHSLHNYGHLFYIGDMKVAYSRTIWKLRIVFPWLQRREQSILPFLTLSAGITTFGSTSNIDHVDICLVSSRFTCSENRRERNSGRILFIKSV